MAQIPGQHGIALAYIASFEHLDGEGNIALRAPHCTQTILPTSLGYKADMTNHEWATHFSSLTKVISAFPVTPVEVLESGNQVTVWAKGRAQFRTFEGVNTATGDWPTFFENEYIFVFIFDDAGQKITRILEMVNSASVEKIKPFLAKMRELANRQPAKQQ